MQSRNERLKTSTLRRRNAMVCHCNQGKLDSRLTQTHPVTGVHACTLGDAFAIQERSEVTVIHQHDLVLHTDERAVTARDASESFWETDRLRGVDGAPYGQRIAQAVSFTIEQHMR